VDGHHLREEFQGVRSEVARMRSEAYSMEQATSVMRAETSHMRQTEHAVASTIPRVREELQQEVLCSRSLRGRISELEGLLAASRRAQTRLEADNSSLHMALDNARGEAQRGAQASVELVAGRYGAEQDVERQASLRREAERRCEVAAAEAERLRRQAEVLRNDHSSLQQRVQAAEAENVLLRGQLRGAEKMLSGLRQECHNLNTRVQYQQLHPGPEGGDAPFALHEPQHGVQMGLSWMPPQLAPQVGVAVGSPSRGHLVAPVAGGLTAVIAS